MLLQETKVSNKVLKKREANRKSGGTMDPAVQDQFKTGRLFACVASRPGQSGRCDGELPPLAALDEKEV